MSTTAKNEAELSAQRSALRTRLTARTLAHPFLILLLFGVTGSWLQSNLVMQSKAGVSFSADDSQIRWDSPIGLTISPCELTGFTIEAGKNWSATFVLHNPTSEPIALGHLFSSCSCLAAEVTANRLEPHENTTLRLAVVLEKKAETEGQLNLTVDCKARDSSKLAFRLSIGLIVP